MSLKIGAHLLSFSFRRPEHFLVQLQNLKVFVIELPLC